MPFDGKSLKTACDALARNTNRAIVFGKINPDLPGLEAFLTYLAPNFDGRFTNNRFARWVRFGDSGKPYKGTDGPSVELQDPLPGRPVASSAGLTVRSFHDFLSRFTPRYYYRLDQKDGIPVYRFSLTPDPAYEGHWREVIITPNDPLLNSLIRATEERSTTRSSVEDAKVQEAYSLIATPQIAMQQKQALHYLTTAAQMLEASGGKDIKDEYAKLYSKAIRSWTNGLGIIALAAEGIRPLLPSKSSSTTPIDGDKIPLISNFTLTDAGLTVTTEEPKAQEKQSETPSGALVPVMQGLQKLQEEKKILPIGERKIAELTVLTDAEKSEAVANHVLHYLVKHNEIDSRIAIFLKTVLTEPEKLTTSNIDKSNLAHWYDQFQAAYALSTAEMFRNVHPLYELMISIWALFREIDGDKNKDGLAEVIIANADLDYLWNHQPAELEKFFEWMNGKPDDEYKNVISFALVHSVQPITANPFMDEDESIDVDNLPMAVRRSQQGSGLSEPIHYDETAISEKINERLSQKREVPALEPVTFTSLRRLLRAGSNYGFMTFYAPQEATYAWQLTEQKLKDLTASYAPDDFTDDPTSDAGVCCLPDFVALPDRTEITIGNLSDGRHITLKTRLFGIRACFPAAGRIMGNDNPAFLKKHINKEKLDGKLLPQKEHVNVPAVALNLMESKAFGAVRLASDAVLDTRSLLLAPTTPFFVFAHKSKEAAAIIAPRTMWRPNDGGPFRLVHHFRQEKFLRRLLTLAHNDGTRVNASVLRAGFEQICKEMILPITPGSKQTTGIAPWYQPDCLNSLPSRLSADKIYIDEEDGKLSIVVNYDQNYTGDFDLDISGRS